MDRINILNTDHCRLKSTIKSEIGKLKIRKKKTVCSKAGNNCACRVYIDFTCLLFFSEYSMGIYFIPNSSCTSFIFMNPIAEYILSA